MRPSLIVILGCFWLFSSFSLAKEDIKFSHLTRQEGLSQSTVFCILQDHIGFMWFGTNDGLNRYDGYEFKHFNHDDEDPNSLTDSWITSIAEDSRQQIWVGTFNYGLCRLRSSGNKFDRINLKLGNIDKGRGQHLIEAIHEIDGHIWVALDGHGIVVVDLDGEVVARYEQDESKPGSLPSNEITALLQTRGGTIFVGTTTGLVRYNKGLQRFETPNYTARDGTLPQHVTELHEDPTGIVWIGSAHEGAYRLNPQSGRIDHFSQENSNLSGPYVRSFLTDSDGVLWIGTQSNGLNRFSPDSNKFSVYSSDFLDPDALKDSAIYSLYQDRSGLVWVGTYSEGVARFNLKLQSFHHVRKKLGQSNTLSGHVVTCFAEDGSMLWVGTRQNGLNLYNPKTGDFQHFFHDAQNPESISSNEIRHVMVDSKSRVWVGTETGLNLLNKERGTFKRFGSGEGKTNPVMFSMEDESGNLWVSTYVDGLNLFDPESARFTPFLFDENDSNTISNNNVNYTYVDHQNRMWVGTEGGLNLMDRVNRQFTRYEHDPKDSQSLAHSSVMASFQREGEKDTLWVGTYGGGLNKLKISSGTFRRFTSKDGLANDSVYGILDDASGSLWITTNNGISCFRPDKGTFRNFDSSNGLLRNEFNRNAYWKGSDGNLYFGSYGFMYFDPERVTGNTYQPSLGITDVLISNQPLEVDMPFSHLKKLVLGPNDKVFSMSIAAMDFNSPDKNHFAHKLEGFRNEWTFLEGRRHDITYTNLSPDTYTLRIKGSNSDVLWSEDELVLTILVKPPVYATWQAYTLYSIIILGIGIALVRQRKVESNRELNRAMSLGKAEFATTVLHNIGNVLNSVKVSCDRNVGILKSTKMRQLLKAQDMLIDNLDNAGYYLTEDPRGKLLPGYFKSAGELVMEEYNEMIRECDEMAEQIALMKDIIETQQAHASISLMDEADNLNEVVRDALKVQENGLINRGIDIEERLRPLPPVKVPKTQVMHIVINLVKNAREAMESNGERQKKLSLETGKYGDNKVFLRVMDTGVGINREDLPKMFSYGFTTKRDGHGFGLNYCSRAMKDMGGSIEVESDGVGKGATFTLLFPCSTD